MSKIEKPLLGEAGSELGLSRPRHGHQLRDGDPDSGSPDHPDVVDPHPSWLKNWRSLRAGLGSAGRDAEASRASARELQDKIAHTPAHTLAGLQAQTELISELAWNDVVAATARQLLAGLKRLQRTG
ncbi:MAG: hypothetical protein ACR2QJ_01780 [Geminicoccaceae bacterium]